MLPLFLRLRLMRPLRWPLLSRCVSECLSVCMRHQTVISMGTCVHACVHACVCVSGVSVGREDGVGLRLLFGLLLGLEAA